MTRPKPQTLIKQARQGQPVQRIEIPKVTCPRCGQTGIYSDPSGQPRQHMRDTRPGEQMYSAVVPTKVACAD